MNKEILPDKCIIDLALFLVKSQTLILGDLHIGFDEAMEKEGVLLPKFHFKDLTDKLQLIVAEAKPKIIILNGDIKHEFGTISDEEWRNTLKVIDWISKQAKLILVKGNHDTILGPIAKKRTLDIRDFYSEEEVFICHGHKMPSGKEFENAKTIILSHDHPALALRDGPRIEKYRCFLLGKWEDKNIIVLPAFSPTAGGSDLLKEKMMSPMLQDISNFRVFVTEGKVFDFGLVKDLRTRMNN